MPSMVTRVNVVGARWQDDGGRGVYNYMSKPYTYQIILTTLALCTTATTARADRFVPVTGMVVCGPGSPTEAASLAVGHFLTAVQRMSGQALPVVYGMQVDGRPTILVGNRATSPTLAPESRFHVAGSADAVNQSYVVETRTGKRWTSIVAAGLGRERSARGSLGMSYALSELVRRLDIRDGKWGFVLPEKPIVATPKVPDRRFYLMNTSYINPGLALERFTDRQIDDYVDMLVDARYSQVTGFQWSHLYLYPGNADARRPENELIHRAMRRFFDRARRRGLRVYEMVTPAHIDPNLLPKDPRFVGKGFYGDSGICWSQPEARALAERVLQTEMEYYGPMDGYTVWFYDPAGCFCQDCKPHQADRLFDQLLTVREIARGISPGARFEAVLWPTWCFDQTKGIDYTRDEVKSMVSRFLDRSSDVFGRRGLTIMDTCEWGFSNLLNGYVSADRFGRNGLLHSIMGATIEQMYPFATLRLRYMTGGIGNIIRNRLDVGTLTIGYAATNRPTTCVFPDMLYDGSESYDLAVRRYAMSVAKGNSLASFVELLKAEDDLIEATTYASKESAVGRMEASLRRVEGSGSFFGDIDWLRGHVQAQRWYLRLAQAKDEESFTSLAEQFRQDVGSIPMYRDFMTKYPNTTLGAHVRMYWRIPVNDPSRVGAPTGP